MTTLKKTVLAVLVLYVWAHILTSDFFSKNTKSLEEFSWKKKNLKQVTIKTDKIYSEVLSEGDLVVKANAKELFDSVAKGEISKLKEYLSLGGDSNLIIGKYKMSLLGMASYYGNKEAVELLVKAEAEINYVDGKGNTAVMLSVMQDKTPDLYKTFLELGIDIDIQNNEGKSFIVVALEAFNNEALKDVLSLDKTKSENLEKAFLTSIDNEDLEQIKLILENSLALSDLKEKGTQSPLFFACKHGKIESLKALLSHQPEVFEDMNFKKYFLKFAKVTDRGCYKVLVRFKGVNKGRPFG